MKEDEVKKRKKRNRRKKKYGGREAEKRFPTRDELLCLCECVVCVSIWSPILETD